MGNEWRNLTALAARLHVRMRPAAAVLLTGALRRIRSALTPSSQIELLPDPFRLRLDVTMCPLLSDRARLYPKKLRVRAW